MTNEELIEALNKNTEAINKLVVLWEKLYAKAVSIEKSNSTGSLTAGGVPLTRGAPAKYSEIEAGGFVL